MKKFSDYQLSKEILRAISILNYNVPTKVQQEVTPLLLDKKDVIVKSQTGSGKTASFAIPICEFISWEENRPQALILTPTRELAMQIKEDVFNIGRFKRIKVSAIYGKSPFYNQKNELKHKTHVVVGTPGRVMDHIERGTIDLSSVKYLVIDEADEMLNMGFIDQVEIIINAINKERVTALLSATMPVDIESLCNKYMKEPIYVEIEEQSKAIDRIVQERYNVLQKDKLNLLEDITILENPDSCIIFCNTKQMVDEVYGELINQNYTVKKLHGGMEQRHRTRVMNEFKLGYFRYLVATDVASRGIDIDNVSLVVNYDIPQDAESYTHRIGRTGRLNKEGKAISFVSKQEDIFLTGIQEYIEREIELRDYPDREIVEKLRQKFVEKMNARPKIKETKGANLNVNITKLHINAGQKTKMRPVDIVGTFCSIEGMTAEDIGVIQVLDISTFVEVLNDKGDLVLDALKTKPIKGRIRSVTKVFY